MSSSYYAVCLSHTPALVLRGTDLGPQGCEVTVQDPVRYADDLDGHAGCDLVLGRFSYPLIAVGCPGSIGNPANRCPGAHRDVIWVDVEWLRLLHQRLRAGQDDEVVRALTRSCWTRDRLDRLSAELRTDDHG